MHVDYLRHMLVVQNLTYAYTSSESFQLDVPEWECPEGGRVAIVGKSGSGKTTFLKCLAGLLQPDSGTIRWKDERVKGADERLVPGNDRIKLVHQDFGQDPHMKVVENLRKYILQHDDEARADRIQKWLNELAIEELGSRKTVQLSGGQLQRVALAQTLLAEPEVMLMDEPFSNLDPIHKQEFIPSLRRLFDRESTTLISVMHDPMDALQMAERVVVFSDGRILEEGTPEELLNAPKFLETVRLFGAVNVLPEAEYTALFGEQAAHPTIDGFRWFRPNEMKLDNLVKDYHLIRRLPMPGETWLELEVDETILVVSE